MDPHKKLLWTKDAIDDEGNVVKITAYGVQTVDPPAHGLSYTKVEPERLELDDGRVLNPLPGEPGMYVTVDGYRVKRR